MATPHDDRVALLLDSPETVCPPHNGRTISVRIPENVYNGLVDIAKSRHPDNGEVKLSSVVRESLTLTALMPKDGNKDIPVGLRMALAYYGYGSHHLRQKVTCTLQRQLTLYQLSMTFLLIVCFTTILTQLLMMCGVLVQIPGKAPWSFWTYEAVVGFLGVTFCLLGWHTGSLGRKRFQQHGG